MMKRVLYCLIVVLWVLSFPFTLRADSVLIKLASLPYDVTAIFAENEKIFVGTSNGLYVSSDGGKTFVAKNKGLQDLEISGITMVKDTVFIGTKEGGLYSGSYSSDSWSSLSSKVDCPTVTSVSSEGSTIYVTSVCSGFHISFDGGFTWSERNGSLPTLRTTSFVKTPTGRCFLGTDHFGLFYSDSLGENCNWSNVFKDYTITALSYFGGTVFVGTNAGLFSALISAPSLKPFTVISGNPYVLSLLNYSNRLFVAFSDFGLYSSSDGINFYKMFKDSLSSPTSVYVDSLTRNLYFGDASGNIFLVNLNKPLLISPDSLNLGTVQKGASITGNLAIENAGSATLTGTIGTSSFVNFKSTTFSNKTNLNFSVDTSSLNPDNYSVPIKLSSNGGDKTVYLNFKVIPQGAVTVKLTIGSLTAYVNGQALALDTAPFIDKKSGRTLVPVRFVSQAFGASVEWDANAKKVTIKREATDTISPKLIELWIGSKIAKVNLQNAQLDVAPVIMPPGRTMVPLRFVGESFEGTVSYDATSKVITIKIGS